MNQDIKICLNADGKSVLRHVGSSQLKGTVFAGGVTSMGEIEGHPALQKAYEMGKRV